jgi:hypothetical protein
MSSDVGIFFRKIINSGRLPLKTRVLYYFPLSHVDKCPRKNTLIKKLFSGSLIIILLIQLQGCLSYKVISGYQLPEYGKYNYAIYGKSLKFQVDDGEISNGILSGKAESKYFTRINTFRIYVTSDSVIKINAENILSIPLASVVRVEKADVPIEKNPPKHKVESPKEPAGKVFLGILYTCTMFVVIGTFRALSSR